MKRSTLTLAVTLALGIAVGAGSTGFVNAMQHVKVTELYKADLVTSDGKEASMFLAELGPGANMGKHYHPTSSRGRCCSRLSGRNRST
jgi:quercetin dioxygenase-like cupin family protein